MMNIASRILTLLSSVVVLVTALDVGNSDMNASVIERLTVLVQVHSAAYNGSIPILAQIAASSQKDALFDYDANGWQPIHRAAYGGRLKVIQFLIEQGAQVNQRTHWGRGYTPMRLAGLDNDEEDEDDNEMPDEAFEEVIDYLKSVGGLDIRPGYCKGGHGVLDIGPEASNRPWAIPFSSFEVAGVNLALSKQEGQKADNNVAEEPFELYADFSIEDMIKGDEDWEDLMDIRRELKRPSLSFYVDKVARKRLLPSMGYAQPHVYALKYASELPAGRRDAKKAIVDLLPTDANYAAKPTHSSHSDGVLLVGVDKNGTTSFSDDVNKLVKEDNLRPEKVAQRLAKSLRGETWSGESWALKNVKPGIVVEERFTDLEGDEYPPLEVKLFTLWGRVWLAQLTYDDENGSWCGGFIHRNGTAFAGTADKFSTIPDWVNWSHLVGIAEQLGANKDMFRTDMFVGVPAGSLATTKEERLAALEYVVSETEVYPTTDFEPFDEIAEEGARLWVAGYKMGNYRVVPNAELTPEFMVNDAAQDEL